MRRFLGFALAAMLVSPLAACGGDTPPPATASTSPPPSTPAPAATPAPAPATPAATVTAVTETSIRVAFAALDASATSVDLLLKHGVIKPGTPTALAIDKALNDTRAWLNVASSLQRAGSAKDALSAFQHAADAAAKINTALGGSNG